MKNKITRREFGATALATALASAMPAPFVWAAEKKYDPGASDTEIKLGQTVPHSGPGSLYGVLGRVGEAYFQMLNEKGGINGRKVKFFTMDDAYSAPKCVEATRRLVEQEEVLALYRLARHRAADRRAQISQLEGRAATAAQHRRVEMERSEELQMDHGGPAALSDRSAHPRQACRRRKAERQGRHPLPERRFRPRFPRPLQEGAGGCRRHRQGDHGAELRSDRADGRFAAHQSLQVGRGRVLQHLDRQGVVAVDPQGGGARLEAAASAVGGIDRPFDPQRRRSRELPPASSRSAMPRKSACRASRRIPT